MASSTGQTKLSTSEMYNQIRPLMCSINTPLGEASGFLLKEGVVLTVAHNILFEEPNLIQLNHSSSDNPFFPSHLPSINQENAKVLDMFAFQTNIKMDRVLPILPEGAQLYEGMKVYFAGFPLGHEKITFHKGVISSLSHDQNIAEFTIDGTIVPGNSGGPVIALHEGKPHLIGIITSEMADFSVEDLKTIGIIEQLKLASDNLLKAPPVGDGGTVIDSVLGLITGIKISTPAGTEVYPLSDRVVLGQAFGLIQRNLSTGIGKAVDIRGYKNLTDATAIATTTAPYFFPTKGKKLIEGPIYYGEKTEANGKKTKIQILKYMEVRYGKGKGPRGIRITMSNGSGSFTYKFSQNPHNAPGNYNKNQTELYENAGITFANQYMQNNTAPPSFTFSACQNDYTADIQTG